VVAHGEYVDLLVVPDHGGESEQTLNDVGWIARAWEWVRAYVDVGNGIALVAALIALIALWFAQRSAKASEDSASAAVRSAAAPETVRLAAAHD
jgi:hypothetical protein